MILTHDGPRWIVVDENGELLHVTFYDWQPGVAWIELVAFGAGLVANCPPVPRIARPRHERGRSWGEVPWRRKERSSWCRPRWRRRRGAIWRPRAQALKRSLPCPVDRIDWLDRAADRFHVKAKMNVEFPTAVACFPSPGAQETLVVCSDGMIAHVAPPRRARGG